MDSYIVEVRERLGETTEIPLDHFPFTIGRDLKNDLPIPSPQVSRRHAYIDKAQRGLTIVDNHSRNGVFLNGKRVAGREQVRAGDIVSIGSAELRFSVATETAVFSGHETVSYFPSPTWDPASTISSGLQEVGEGRRPQSLPWDKLFRLLVEAPSPALYDTVLESVEAVIPFDRCFLIMLEEDSADGLKVVARRQASAISDKSSKVYVSSDILGRVVKSGEAVVVTLSDSAFNPTQSFILSGARAALCLPLVTRGNVSGVLYLDRFLSGEPFSEEDVESLGPLAGLVALKVENLQLFDAYLEAELNKRDLEIAKAVQEGFLPEKHVALEGFSVECTTQSCREVGGDCFDLITKEKGKLTFVIGDVSGKGLPAALYMVGVLSTLRAHVDERLSLQLIMEKLERYVRATFRPDYFLTLVVGDVDASTGLLSYCTAGHMPPVVFAPDGKIVELEATDPALNVIPFQDFRRFEYYLDPGDLLLVYTDGFTEAYNDKREEFGKERLFESLRQVRDQPLVSVRKTLFSAVQKFSAQQAPRDDMSLVLLRREKLFF